MTLTRFAPLALVLALVSASHALAQDVAPRKNRFALGGDFKIKATDHSSDEDYARGELGPGLLWRFGTGKDGWGFHWGLNWYSVNLERPIGGAVTELGKLHLRPVMAGYGYTRTIRSYVITADVLGGYAFGSMTLGEPAVAAYQRSFGGPASTARATNAVVLKPEIGVWYDMHRRMYLNVNAGYMIARPDVTIVTAAVADTRTARADQFILKVGVVYSIF